MAPAANANESGSSPVTCSTRRNAITAPTGCGRLVAIAARNCRMGPAPAAASGIAVTVPSGTFWTAIATSTNTPRPLGSAAQAEPMASPSGREWTNRTRKTSAARRRPAVPSRRWCVPAAPSTARAPSRKSTPATRPAATAAGRAGREGGPQQPEEGDHGHRRRGGPQQRGAPRDDRVAAARHGQRPEPRRQCGGQARQGHLHDGAEAVGHAATVRAPDTTGVRAAPHTREGPPPDALRDCADAGRVCPGCAPAHDHLR